MLLSVAGLLTPSQRKFSGQDPGEPHSVLPSCFCLLLTPLLSWLKAWATFSFAFVLLSVAHRRLPSLPWSMSVSRAWPHAVLPSCFCMLLMPLRHARFVRIVELGHMQFGLRASGFVAMLIV